MQTALHTFDGSHYGSNTSEQAACGCQWLLANKNLFTQQLPSPQLWNSPRGEGGPSVTLSILLDKQNTRRAKCK